ncbi:MAG: ParB/RepB/Spo0J family partition protein [Aphanocapsa feldmannii 288cV]|nr:MAG: ParB/RepB/Spo0J family partition protein [Aphanocapsa feldmannii 288cV]
MPRNLSTIIEIPLDQIVASPWETRKTIDQQGIEELADSIDQVDLLQPIVVRPIRRNLYERSSGQRRMLAWQLLVDRGRKKPTDGIPAIVQDLSDREMVLATLAENSARQDVDTVEEARAMALALETAEGLTQKDLAEAVSTSPANLSNRLRILRLPDSVLQLVSEGRMAWTTARELLCFVGADHIHAEEIALVLEEARGWHNGFTGPVIRREIIDACRKNRWRRLDAETPIMTYGALDTKPVFDTKAFGDAHPELLHRIPTSERSGQCLVTCADKAWLSAQEKAKKALGHVGNAKPVQNRALWADVMATDQVVKCLGLAREKFSGEKSLTDEELDALGTRARFVKVAPSSYKEISAKGWYSPPKFFPSGTCFSTCTDGAVYAPSANGGTPFLHCSNAKCYAQKCAEGKARAQAKEERRMVHVDAARRKHRDAVERALKGNPEVARAVLALAVAEVTGRPEAPPGYGYHDGREQLYYHAPSATRLAVALGLSLDDVQEKLDRREILWYSQTVLDDIVPQLDDPVPAAAEALSILMQRMEEQR